MSSIEFQPDWGIALDRLCERVLQIRSAVGDAWPYHCDPMTGLWDTTDDGDWCGGHWVECLRIVGELTGERKLLKESTDRVEKLRPYLERDDMFRGHRFYYAAARQYAWTGDQRHRTLALAAAWAVRAMAIPSNGAMPIGTQVQVRSTTLSGRDKVCCDNVHPSLILDWWAYKETGDPVFVDGARRHLDLTERDFILEDGSTVEFADYDVLTGRPLRYYTLLGAHDTSCWSRGQAWVIAGYLRAWEALRDPRYLAIGSKCLRYWVEHSDVGCVPPWDFKDPALIETPAGVPLDTSASAIVVEQLARLALVKDAPKALDPVVSHLPIMLNGLLVHLDHDGRLLNGCFNQPKRYANRSELIWGTAYLLFALYYLKTGRVVE
jgi:unsaturated chondroitin disaccharide hydrolase